MLQANIVCDPITNSYKFLKGFETTLSYVSAPGPIIFSITGLTNPATTVAKAFTVSTYNIDGSLFPIDTANDLFSLNFVAGSMIINSITVKDSEINGKTGSWAISMTAEHAIEPNYLLRLKFPIELGVQQLAKCTITAISPAINSAYLCKGDGANNQI